MMKFLCCFLLLFVSDGASLREEQSTQHRRLDWEISLPCTDGLTTWLALDNDRGEKDIETILSVCTRQNASLCMPVEAAKETVVTCQACVYSDCGVLQKTCLPTYINDIKLGCESDFRDLIDGTSDIRYNGYEECPTIDDHLPGKQQDYCKSEDEDDDGCFSAEDEVTLESGLSTRFSDLKVGDRILSADKTGDLSFSDVVFLPHGLNHKKATFIELTTATGKQLRATKSHLMVTCDGTTVAAGDLSPGFCLRTVDGEDILKATKKVQANGIYTAITHNEFIVVGGVIASPFAMNHELVNSYYNIHRFAYNYFPDLLQLPIVSKINEYLGGAATRLFVTVAGKI